MITCNEIIDADVETKSNDQAKSNKEETETITTNINEKNITCKIQNFYILLAFLLITIALLISVSIYCYLIKYQAKQKHLIPFHDTNNELKQVLYQKYKLKMSNKIKNIDIRNHTYYFFDDTINIKIFDPNDIKIHEKSYKNILNCMFLSCHVRVSE